MDSFSYISNAHPTYIENMYESYKTDANTVEEDWRKFFEGFEFALNYEKSNGVTNGAKTVNGALAAATGLQGDSNLLEELKVFNLIMAYRHKGHLIADTNPIRQRKDRKPHLALADFDLTEEDLDKTFYVGNEIRLGRTSLRNIISRLNDIYCRSIGLEYAYVNAPEAIEWLRDRFETQNGSFGFDINKKKHILGKLNETVAFEEFLHKKYIGQKRFSLEGGESTIPALDAIINKTADLGVEEVIIGMAHRGRLNVLTNIMGKTYEEIFSEFEGHVPENHEMGDGDVKYHLGFFAQKPTTSGKDLYLTLLPNPSHLEAVDSIVQGYARAKADEVYESNYESILPILVHGDAAIAGQGIVYEMAQMSKLPGYYTGGIIHFVINNQIGFTTDFDDARSAHYSTSIASIVKAPVMHVNGDDVEAVVFAAETAAAYRQKFKSDIYIDMVCYRKHGHNEGDDPKYTQPGLYKLINKHDNPRVIYSNKLLAQKDVDGLWVKSMEKEFNKFLQERLDMVKEKAPPYKPQKPELDWQALRNPERADFDLSPVTGIDKARVNQIVEGLIQLPENFKPLRKINKYLERRRKEMKDKKSLDWAAAELMAYATILVEGYNVRMSGQDVKRGTFSHRHAMVYDENTFQEFNRLSQLSEDQGQFMIYNSFLSEYAVLGFEIGYSYASPNGLNIWEAQFGDFANGAQIMIDQFLSSSKSKWDWSSGIILLLPHGYEGQGPEHSSARLERFLQLCSELNMRVCNITSPANFFHALRRQHVQPFRTPLVVMSPKSLLRHPKCVSSIFEIIGEQRFQEILDDPFIEEPTQVKKLLLCSGKIYYELAAKQEADNRKDVAIVRLEQLYPIARKQLDAIFEKYAQAKITWVQEEPANMGALWHLLYKLRGVDFDFIARKASASPATGFKYQHEKQQADIINRAFA